MGLMQPIVSSSSSSSLSSSFSLGPQNGTVYAANYLYRDS